MIIEIKGKVGCGKSGVINIIRDALNASGIKVTIRGSYDPLDRVVLHPIPDSVEIIEQRSNGWSIDEILTDEQATMARVIGLNPKKIQ